MAIDLAPHQLKAVSEMHNGCILVGGVGTGKSRTALAYYFTQVAGGTFEDVTRLETPTDIYIITTAKKRDEKDWETEAARFAICREREASVGGVKLCVDSWNNISKYKNVRNAFFIFDEQRLVGSGAWTKAFTKIAKHNEWVLLSATPGDTWLDYIPVFIANGFYQNRTEFKDTHVVYNNFAKYPKVDKYINTGRLVRYRNRILVEMPYARHTHRNYKMIIVDHDEVSFDLVLNKRWNIFEERPIRDVAEMFHLMRRVVNSDPSRVRALWNIHKDHPRLIVFYNFDYELEILRGFGKYCHVAEWNGHRHDPIPGDNHEKWIYLVQYTAGSEGWNCIDTDTIVFYSQTYSYKTFHQAHGRIDRLNTPFINLYYYNLVSKSLIDQAIRQSLNSKKTFNESAFHLSAA